MEYVLLAKVGFVIGVVVKTGYVIAGGYLAKTIHRYYSDYKISTANERSVS
jgi:hypothetical protein